MKNGNYQKGWNSYIDKIPLEVKDDNYIQGYNDAKGFEKMHNKIPEKISKRPNIIDMLKIIPLLILTPIVVIQGVMYSLGDYFQWKKKK